MVPPTCSSRAMAVLSICALMNSRSDLHMQRMVDDEGLMI